MNQPGVLREGLNGTEYTISFNSGSGGFRELLKSTMG